MSPVKAWDSDGSSGSSENDPTVVPFDPVPPPRLLSVRSRAPATDGYNYDDTANTSGRKPAQKELRVCAVTWNMCGRKFPSNLEPMLAPLFGRGDDGDVVRGWSAADDDEDGIDTPCDMW